VRQKLFTFLRRSRGMSARYTTTTARTDAHITAALSRSAPRLISKRISVRCIVDFDASCAFSAQPRSLRNLISRATHEPVSNGRIALCGSSWTREALCSSSIKALTRWVGFGMMQLSEHEACCCEVVFPMQFRYVAQQSLICSKIVPRSVPCEVGSCATTRR